MITDHGWNTWDARHLNAVVSLPGALRIRFSLLDPSTGEVKDEFGWRQDTHRLGLRATDGSYAEIALRWGDRVVRLEYAARSDRLGCRATPVSGAIQLALIVACDGAWDQAVTASHAGAEFRAQAGGRDWVARVHQIEPDAGAADDASAAWRGSLGRGVLVEAQPDAPGRAPAGLRETAAFIDGQRAAAIASGLRSDGWLAGAADALTRSIAWNTIWEPVKGRVCTPVSRDWCKGPFFGSYVLFDWDTYFCAVMAQLTDPALAEANVLAIQQEVAAAGFIPNFGCQFGPSEDRSQPPVGAYCVLKLHRAGALGRANLGRGLLERSFPALLRWHAWWMPHRDGNGDGLLEWGTDPIPGYRDPSAGTLQGAMYESGLDNSPMYDETAYNPRTHTMELADVGLNALYALDAWALSEIARELGQVTRSQELAAEYAQVSRRINDLLWSEEAGIYLNRHWDGRFSPHLSPTLFYPLIAGVATPERAERMVREHLLNARQFWGRYVLPSISRDDPGYAGNDYWRGRIWGPMNFLVGEGLRRYRFDDVTRAFAGRGLDLLLGEWRDEGHVHENYNADTGDGDDMPNSDPQYTWGALLGYIAMQELVDCEPWGGWRFGRLSPEPASLSGVRVAEGILDVTVGPGGLEVLLNGRLFLRSDRPVLVRNLRREAARLACRIEPAPDAPTALTFGGLPPGQPAIAVIDGEAARMTVDPDGCLTIYVSRPGGIEIEWM